MKKNDNILKSFFTRDGKYRLKRFNTFLVINSHYLNISKNKPKNLTLIEYI